MSEVDFQLWEFEDAPPDLRRLVAEDFSHGWLALVSSSDPAYLAFVLATWWQSTGLPLVWRETSKGALVLAGPHPGKNSAAHSVISA